MTFIDNGQTFIDKRPTFIDTNPSPNGGFGPEWVALGTQ
jgi:hypothetical protein